MENTPIYPHIKVFYDSDNEVHLLTYTYPDKQGHKHDKHIGIGLIDFITLDMTEFKQEIKKANAKKALTYDDMRNLIFDLAEFFKGKHDYVYFFLIGKLNRIFEEEVLAQMQFERCFEEFQSIMELHKTFGFGVNLCLDIENLREYSMSEKFVGFVTRYKKYTDFAFKTGFRISPTYKGKLDFDIVKAINRKDKSDKRTLLKAVHRDAKGVSLAGYTLIESLDEMLYFEFIELLKQGLQVKRCKLCDKYFILTSKHDTDFCDRIYKRHRTCKQVGAKKTYNERVKDDPVLQEYQRIYKRYFARGDMPFNKNPNGRFFGMSFREWAKIATEMRKKYLSGEISGEELVAGVDE